MAQALQVLALLVGPLALAAAADSGGGLAAPPDTLEALLLPLLDRAYGLALRLQGNRADAEDLVQEAALAASRGFGTFQQGTNFKAWFFRVLVNCFYTRRKRERRAGPHVDLDDVPEVYLYGQTVAAGLPQQSPDPAQALLGRLDSQEIVDALASLPEEYRVVSTLYFIDDLSYDVIARIVGIPVGTVRSRLHRGRKMLQKRLWRVAVERGVVADPAEAGSPS
jgi:RNA polymerase sigma-70 factor, ECF subfamily